MGIGSMLGFPLYRCRRLVCLGLGGLGLAGAFITREVAFNQDGWRCCLGDGGFAFLLIPWSFG